MTLEAILGKPWHTVADVSWRLFLGCLVVLFFAWVSGCPAWAIQCVYPNGDEDNTTYWWDSPGSSTTHYTLIDEDTACDGSHDSTTTDISEDDGSTYRALLTDPTDPEVGTGHTWYCYASITSNKAHTLTVDLYEGSTQINTTTSCATSSLTVSVQKLPNCTLTTTEANSISTYSDLRLYITATATNPTDVFVTSCNLELPDAPAAGDELMVIGR